MKKYRYKAEQIAFALWQAESGTPVIAVCRKMGNCEQSVYRWKKKYVGVGVPEVRKLNVLEQENSELKQLVADLSSDKTDAAGCAAKKALKPAQKRDLVEALKVCYKVSTRRACKVLQIVSSTYQYRCRKD